MPPRKKGQKFTAREKRFVKEYPKDLNGTRAAIDSGYSEKTAVKIATELLKKPHIKQAIKKEIQAMLDRAEIKAWMVLKETALIAFSNIKNVADFGGGRVKLKDSDDLHSDLTASVSEVSESKHGVRIKMHSKIDALKVLADYLNLSGSGDGEEDQGQTIFVAPEMATEESWKKLV